MRGGPSSEYEVSLKSGASVLAALDRDKYDPRDLFVDRAGVWHNRGVAAEPAAALAGVDVVFNTIHGQYGEDGTVQRLFESLGVPYTGSGPFESALTYNKHLTRESVQKLGIKVPVGRVLTFATLGPVEDAARELFRTFPHPAIIKPLSGGSSLDTTLAGSYHELAAALADASARYDQVLIEEFIRGREATVGVIDDFRNERTYTLLPTEIVLPPQAKFYDTEAKYSGATRLVTPASFTTDIKAQLQHNARTVHQNLGLRHFSRSDFIVSRRGIYYLETDAVSDVTDDSEFVHGLQAVGASLSHFIDHIISLARRGH